MGDTQWRPSPEPFHTLRRPGRSSYWDLTRAPVAVWAPSRGIPTSGEFNANLPAKAPGRSRSPEAYSRPVGESRPVGAGQFTVFDRAD
jgi:hypothetical protein